MGKQKRRNKMSFTATQKRVGLNSMNVYAQRAKLGDLVYGAAAGSYPLDYPGLVYYVNNTTGSASNSGLSWETAFAQVSQAISAWNTAQALLSDVTSRGRIYIAGTATAYTALTALCSYCDFIGIGADPRGNGIGIARIGLDDLGVSGVIAASSTYRGLYFENLQFQMGSGYAFKVQNLYRSQFVNCAFMGDNTSNGGTTGVALEKASGVEFLHCHWGSAATKHAICMDITGTHFHNCIVDDCVMDGTIGMRLATGTTSGQGSMVTRSYLSTLDDNATAGKVVYANNFMGASGALANAGAARYIGNYEQNGFSTVTGS
jgi:hypothetical protein